MDKKSLLAVLLIFIVFWLSNELIWKQRPSDEPETVPVEVPERALERDPQPEPSVTPAEEQPDLDSIGFVSDVPVTDKITLSNESVTYYFSNLGATIQQAELHNYYMSDQARYVTLIPENERLFAITVKTDETEINLSEQVFEWEKQNIGDHELVTFSLYSQENSVATITYILIDDYHLQVNLEIENLGETDGYTIAMNSGISDTEESLRHKDNDYKFATQVRGSQESYTLRQLKRLDNGESISGNVDWAAVRSKYFLQALLTDEQLQASDINLLVNNDSPAYNLHVRPGRNRAVIEDSYQLYIGPMVYDNLEQFGVGLEEMMELGWRFIRPLGRLFLIVITAISRVVPNYGVTIIVFALLLKVVLYPLTHKSFKSMQKMQKMQPFMQEIQRKYKSDPKKMQTELGKLYKEHGTNPAGGCFPLLLQMPVFFALYPVLRYSIELRQASFMLWIQDLSEPDPYMILPIVMGLFMFVQQKMSAAGRGNPEKMDDKQKAAMQSQKMMMYIMPVFMVFIFRGLPSGLVLYWTIFNVFSIVQQYFIKKQLA